MTKPSHPHPQILNICLNLFLLFLFQLSELSELEMNEDLSVKSLTQSQDMKLFNPPMESFVCQLKNTFSNINSYVDINFYSRKYHYLPDLYLNR